MQSGRSRGALAEPRRRGEAVLGPRALHPLGAPPTLETLLNGREHGGCLEAKAVGGISHGPVPVLDGPGDTNDRRLEPAQLLADPGSEVLEPCCVVKLGVGSDAVRLVIDQNLIRTAQGTEVGIARGDVDAEVDGILVSVVWHPVILSNSKFS